MRSRTAQSLLASLALVASMNTTSCRKKTDEQRLRDRIDCTEVHLYVATKLALTGDGSNADVQRIRGLMAVAAVTSMQAVAAAVHALDGRTPEQRANAAPAVTFRPQDLATLVVALWHLRAEGARLVRTGADDQIPSVVLSIARDTHTQLSPELRGILNTRSEHALFFMLLFMLKFDSHVPVPVPPELLLYEGYRTNPEQSQLPGMEGMLHGLKAYVYGTNDFCDLSHTESQAVDHFRANPANTARTLRALSEGRISTRPEELQSFNDSVTVVGHGGSALCFIKRGEISNALTDLNAILDAFDRLGVSTDETAVLRAFIAYEQGRPADARAALARARQSTTISATTRAQIEALDSAIANNDQRAVRRVMNQLALAEIIARILYHRLERSGAIDELRQTAIYRQVDGYLRTASSTIDQAKSTVGRGAAIFRR